MLADISEDCYSARVEDTCGTVAQHSMAREQPGPEQRQSASVKTGAVFQERRRSSLDVDALVSKLRGGVDVRATRVEIETQFNVVGLRAESTRALEIHPPRVSRVFFHYSELGFC